MIVSLHVTHTSAGNVSGLNEIIPALEKNINECIGAMDFVQEYVVVRTCNRFEVYTSTFDNEMAKKAFRSITRRSIPYSQDEQLSFILEGNKSVAHLFRVVCGLDSLIVGEDQIQHQVKESYLKAREDGHANIMLAYLFDHALIVGKRVRSETALNKGAVSVGSAAVELAEQKIGSLCNKTVTVLGAGDMASVIAKNLVGKGPKAVFVSNRTLEHAKELAGQLNGTAITFDHKVEAITDSDLVLVATSAPHVVIRKADIEVAMRDRMDRKLLMIDVSVPRNIAQDVVEVENVEVETMDSLQSIAMENVARRTAEISEAEHIINEELSKMDRERKEKAANAIIRELSIKFASIKDEEVAQAKSRALANPDINSILEDLSRALVSSITSELFINLRQASRNGDFEACNTAKTLFGLEDD
ncbi:MAG: glutamyl-tRNA reductase [Candidatus Methanogranum gryphiswaldense]|nr:MAG: glutamyl-tRNA reductase [Candidatus Methanogranum sp. U3.2.1]